MSRAADLASVGAGIASSANATAISISATEVVTLLTSAVATSEGGAVTTNIAQGLAKAWANFTGVTTTALRDSFNVASLTDVATGKTNVVYTTAMANVNYSGAYYTNAEAGSNDYNFSNGYTGAFGIGSNGRTTTLIGLGAHTPDGFADSYQNDVLILGDLA
jgi:hypothetical protein